MNKAYKQTSSFLDKLKTHPVTAPQPQPANALRSMFGINTQDRESNKEIEELLLEYASPTETKPRQFRHDVEQLQLLTAEIRSIQRQSALLLGERIYKAREILKKYRRGGATFTQWMSTTFSSRRTAYNWLAYYEFYTLLPNEKLKQQMQTMSHQALYILASRTGSWEKKIAIVEKFSHLKQKEILPIIRKTFPLTKSERKSYSQPIIETASSLSTLLKNKISLTSHEMRELRQLRALIDRACNV